MKTSIIASAMILALAAAGQASANTGTITFTGEVTDTTCNVSGGDNSSGSSGSFTVPLQPVSSTLLAATNDRAGNTAFSIIVGGTGQTGCTDGKMASMHWENTTTAVNANGHLVNTAATGAATGVAVALKNGFNSNEINLNNTADPNLPKVAISDNTAELKFEAEYVRTTGALTAGNFTSALRYSVVYN